MPGTVYTIYAFNPKFIFLFWSFKRETTGGKEKTGGEKPKTKSHYCRCRINNLLRVSNLLTLYFGNFCKQSNLIFKCAKQNSGIIWDFGNHFARVILCKLWSSTYFEEYAVASDFLCSAQNWFNFFCFQFVEVTQVYLDPFSSRAAETLVKRGLSSFPHDL